ncbi:HAD-like domain-containing protein [Butyriboletus roseoflavus]|nr:HAD-like domain-containing protein [Butyriboletus roseoflavus]
MGALQRIALNMEILEFDKSGKTKGKSFKYVLSHPSGFAKHDGASVVLSWVDGIPPTHIRGSARSLPLAHTIEPLVSHLFITLTGREDCKTYLTTPIGADERRPVDFTDGFIDFKKFCDESDIPFTIVSSGMDELIRAVLTELAKGSDEDAVKDIPIVSNGVRRDATGKWFVTWRHPESDYGHDKSRAILPYREYRRAHHGRGPTVFFFGDGVSDLSAAQHADVLFVKVTGIDEKDNLKKHCDKAGIPYIPFLDFNVAKAIVGQIVRGEKTKDDFLVKSVSATTLG